MRVCICISVNVVLINTMYVCIMHLGINKCLHLEIFNVICSTIRLECRTHLENYKIFVSLTFSPNIQQRKEQILYLYTNLEEIYIFIYIVFNLDFLIKILNAYYELIKIGSASKLNHY